MLLRHTLPNGTHPLPIIFGQCPPGSPDHPSRRTDRAYYCLWSKKQLDPPTEFLSTIAHLLQEDTLALAKYATAFRDPHTGTIYSMGLNRVLGVCPPSPAPD